MTEETKEQHTPVPIEKLQQDLERSRVIREIEENKFSAATNKAYKQALNRNLRNNRKRARAASTPDYPERDYSRLDREQAIALARKKIEESPIAYAISQSLADNVVGQGLNLQMLTGDKEWDSQIEEAWDREKDKLDLRKVRRWDNLLRMWYSRKDIDGDVGLVLVDGGVNEDGTVNSYVQTIEAERIRKNQAGQDSGIEFDKFGVPKRYFVRKRNEITKEGQIIPNREPGIKIAAKNFIHYAHFPQERAERQRGVSKYLQVFNLLEDLDKVIENMVLKVENESFIGLKFNMEAAPDGSLFGKNIEQIKQAEDGKRRKHVRMVPGMNIRTDPGEDVDMLESKNPNSEWIPFVRFLLRKIGVNFGVPLELLFLDFKDTNFSGARGLLELTKKRFKIEQDSLCWVASRVFGWWLSRKIKVEGLKVPASIEGMQQKHIWNKSGWPYLDPLKEANAFGKLLELGVTTRGRIISETSDSDFETIARERAREQDILDEINPPAPAPDEPEEDLEDKEDEEETAND